MEEISAALEEAEIENALNPSQEHHQILEKELVEALTENEELRLRVSMMERKTYESPSTGKIGIDMSSPLNEGYRPYSNTPLKGSLSELSPKDATVNIHHSRSGSIDMSVMPRNLVNAGMDMCILCFTSVY